MKMKKNQSFEGSLSLSTLTLILYPGRDLNPYICKDTGF